MTITLKLPDPLYVGTTITAELEFQNPGSTDLVVPSDVFVKYQEGGDAGTWTTLNYPPDITKSSDDVFTCEIPVTVAGQGTVKGIGTGVCAIVEVAYFQALTPPGP